MIDYNPNLTLSGNLAKQTWEIRLQCWKYFADYTVETCNNLRGPEAISAAVNALFDELAPHYDEDDAATWGRIVLTDESGNTLECDDEDGKGLEWLAEYVCSARLTAFSDGGNMFRHARSARPTAEQQTKGEKS